MVGFGHVESWVQTWKPYSSWTGKYFDRIIPWRPKCVCQFANWLQTVLDFPVSSNHCRCTAHYKLFLKAKTKVITNRETKEHHTPVQRLTYLKKNKMGQIRQFQPFFVLFVVISFALFQGHGTCQNSLTGPLCCSLKLTVRSYFTLPQTINHVWLVNTFFKSDQS